MSQQYEIIKLPAYRAVGLRWEGTYKEVHTIRDVIHTMKSRVEELPQAVKPDAQLGLSYHLIPEGFVHYSVFEVGPEQTVPDDMVEIVVPEMTYLFTRHEGGNIGETYNQVALWLEQNGYTPAKEPGVTYYDPLPIKHERYSLLSDSQDPHFDILIPVEPLA
ncbi:GyrI-like domain-containing protein [Paenibacillus senegalensis]|uniref:GyrI-like domain-containing protein n=1 Tax=Paenibacillus senegalensis TaxID=1465766 RepID=UPI000287C9A4|nr:GyrI-like domain-containing protein [Paenibacillus senegalensis]